MDLSELDTADESVMTVMAGGKSTDWQWTFAGPGHPSSVTQSNRVSREALQRQRTIQQAQANGKKYKAPEQTPEEVQEDNVAFVLERLLGWSTVTVNGEPFPFSQDNARKILMDRRKGALLQQAIEFLLDDNSFYAALAEDLTDFAGRYFHLAASDGGETRRAKLERQLEQAETRAKSKANAKRIREIEAELAMPPFPVALAYLWRAYLRLRHRTQGGMPIVWQDIDAFIRRSGLRLVPWEIETIERLDDIYLDPKPQPPAPEGQAVVALVSAADAAGVRAILGSISKRRTVKRDKGGIPNG